MSELQLASENERQIWENDYLREYVRESGFKNYMGTASSSIIVVKHELEKESGKTINIPLITRTRNRGVGGSTALDGKEATVGNFNCPITIDWIRNGIVVTKAEEFKTEIDLYNAARDLNMDWSSEQLRMDLIYALMSVVPSGNTTVPYAEITEDATAGGYEIVTGYTPGTVFDRYEGVPWTTASEANKDAFLAANRDRVLCGKTRSNTSSNDHSTALATLDTTDDRMTCATASLAKRMARNANPRIRPFKIKDGREFFVQFTGPRSFRDLKNDTNMISANRDARAREGNGMDSNPLFQDGDLIYDGIIFREIPEIPHITGAGSSTDVEPNFLCGQQAVGLAWGKTPSPTSEIKDYKFRRGAGVEELRNAKKLAFNGKQHGVVTLYTAAPADA